MKNLICLIGAGIFLVLCGCSIFPDVRTTKIYYYDLGEPLKETKNCDFNISINRIRTEGPFRERMVFRESVNSICFDEYSRWSYLPADMVKNYFVTVLGSDKQQKKQYTIDADIMRFESNLQDLTSVVTIDVTVRKEPGDTIVIDKVYEAKVKADEKTSSAYAKSIAKAVSEISVEIKKDIESLK